MLVNEYKLEFQLKKVRNVQNIINILMVRSSSSECRPVQNGLYMVSVKWGCTFFTFRDFKIHWYITLGEITCRTWYRIIVGAIILIFSHLIISCEIIIITNLSVSLKQKQLLQNYNKIRNNKYMILVLSDRTLMHLHTDTSDTIN
jgi:hypothetical protein